MVAGQTAEALAVAVVVRQLNHDINKIYAVKKFANVMKKFDFRS